MNILCLSCTDKSGIVADVANSLSAHHCNIEESSQFNDPLSGQFFMRVVFSTANPNSFPNFLDAFQAIAKKYKMEWQIHNAIEKIRTIIMVSQYDHCLNDLLYRWRTHHLNIDITCVVSNHTACQKLVESHNIPFVYKPITANNKEQAETELRKTISATQTDLIVLARYMQIMSEDFCKDFHGRLINIHHSFLPGFKGAQPYRQAYERGVKIIGATAHFATADLDEGPIIAQGIEAVTHTHTPQKMQSLGQDTENRILAKALELYSERRIFLNGNRTIIL